MAGGGRMRDENRRIRHERLQNVYKIIADLYRHEDERLSDTFNIVTLIQTILLAGFLQLSLIDPAVLVRNEMLQLLKLVLPCMGVFLSLLGLYAFHRRVEAMQYWMRSACQVEEDEDFWLTYNDARDAGLDIFTTRMQHLEKHKSKYPGFIARLLKYQRYYMGIIFLSQWVFIIVLLLLT